MPLIARLKETLTTAETSATDFEIDQIAFLIGSFPKGHRLYNYAKDCPRVQKLLPEMISCRSDTEAMFRIADTMEKDNIVGRVAERIAKALRS